MQMLKSFGLCALSAALAAGVGCTKVGQDSDPHIASQKNPPVAGTNIGTMTPASRSRSAAEQIAESRCEREQQCGNIGKDKTFSSSQDCLARIQSDWKADLNSRACPGGINQKELDQCLGQVRAEACANPFDTLARVTECTVAQICIEQP